MWGNGETSTIRGGDAFRRAAIPLWGAAKVARLSSTSRTASSLSVPSSLPEHWICCGLQVVGRPGGFQDPVARSACAFLLVLRPATLCLRKTEMRLVHELRLLVYDFGLLSPIGDGLLAIGHRKFSKSTTSQMARLLLDSERPALGLTPRKLDKGARMNLEQTHTKLISIALAAVLVFGACSAGTPAPSSEENAPNVPSGFSIPASQETTRQTGVVGYLVTAPDSTASPSRLRAMNAQNQTVAWMEKGPELTTIGHGETRVQWSMKTTDEGTELRMIRSNGDLVVLIRAGQGPVMTGAPPSAEETQALELWQLIETDLKNAQTDYKVDCGYCIRQRTLCLGVEAVTATACFTGNWFACAGGAAAIFACWNTFYKDCRPCPCDRSNWYVCCRNDENICW